MVDRIRRFQILNSEVISALEKQMPAIAGSAQAGSAESVDEAAQVGQPRVVHYAPPSKRQPLGSLYGPMAPV